MIKRTLAAIAVTIALLPDAKAATLAQHIGSSDPATEGWRLSSDATSVFSGGTEMIGRQTYDYWETQDLSDTNYSAYIAPLPTTLRENAWSMLALVRVVDSPLVPGYTVGGQSVAVSDGISIWQFNFSNDRAGPVTEIPFSYAATVELDTRAAYHLYRIDFNPNQAGWQDDTADFYVDGSLVLPGVARDRLAGASGANQLLFGNASSPGISTARYAFVALSAVPELNTYAQMALGLSILAITVLRSGVRSSIKSAR